MRTARRAYVVGRALGQTNIFFFDANGRQIANVEIRVEPDVAPLNELLRRHAPDARIVAEAVERVGRALGHRAQRRRGRPRLPDGADFPRHRRRRRRWRCAPLAAPHSPGSGAIWRQPPRVINMIQVEGSEQVLVRVRVVEMSRTLGAPARHQSQLRRDDQSAAARAMRFVDIATAQRLFDQWPRCSAASPARGGVARIDPASRTASPIPAAAAGTGAQPVRRGRWRLLSSIRPHGNLLARRRPRAPPTSRLTASTDASIEAFERAGLLRVSGRAEPHRDFRRSRALPRRRRIPGAGQLRRRRRSPSSSSRSASASPSRRS